tara:strand:- start:333 stop:776 length:444 start_codon:yes stop_codon:yes gene_type:complete
LNYEGVNHYNPVFKQQAIFMKMELKKKLKKPSGLGEMKMMMDMKKIQGAFQKGVATTVAKKESRVQNEKNANVYKFNTEILATPTSLNMMNAVCLKGANVELMDELFTKMKKRRNVNPYGVPAISSTFQHQSIGPMSAAPSDGKIMS